MLRSRIAAVRNSPLLGALIFLSALTVFLTWPQALHLGTRIADHGDPLLSIWRLEWLAIGAQSASRPLFDGNIFYPHLRTLAYSDATLLQGALAAPWLQANVNPVLVYNLLLLAGIVTSGLGMFVLVRHLTGSADAALVAAAIFTMAPYRVEHFMHLELQWTAWMPLTLWAVHRAFESGSMRIGVLAGFFLCLQVLSSMYYGAFLAMIVGALVLMLAASEPERIPSAFPAFAVAGLMVAGVTLVYAQPYIQNARTLGVRNLDEVTRFSAHLASYVTAPAQNWLWGWTSNVFAFEGNELHLFAGVIAVVLAAFAFARPSRPLAWKYLVLTAIAAVLSFGTNGPVYRWLYDHVWAFGAFRAPARFAILVFCGLSVLAGLGFDWLQQQLTVERARRALLVGALVAIAIEFGSLPMYLREVPAPVPDVYKFVRTLDPAVMIELPEPWSPWYVYWSTTHWRPLVNGFSGYVPPDYDETIKLMAGFPDDEAIARLRRLDVRYVLVHEAFFTNKAYTEMMLKVLRRPDLIAHGRYRDWVGWTHLFELDQGRANAANQIR
jgi:hypothetical protein